MPNYIEDWRAIAQEWLAPEFPVITTAVYARNTLKEYPGILLYPAVVLKDDSYLLLGMQDGEPYLVFPVT